MTRFEVEVDGNAVKDLQTLDNWQPDLPGKTIAYSGYRWQLSAREGATYRVKVRYDVSLPITDGASFFRYALRTGGMWASPIGSETVSVKADPSLHLSFPQSSLKLVERDGKWVCELRDERPKDDMEMVIRLRDRMER